MEPELSTAQILTEANCSKKKSCLHALPSPLHRLGEELSLWPKADFDKDVPTEICMCLVFAEDIYTWKFSKWDSIFSLTFTGVLLK